VLNHWIAAEQLSETIQRLPARRDHPWVNGSNGAGIPEQVAAPRQGQKALMKWRELVSEQSP
jgi:hypothetical protein